MFISIEIHTRLSVLFRNIHANVINFNVLNACYKTTLLLASPNESIILKARPYSDIEKYDFRKV